MGTKIRLGGMALSNGVLVHGPTSWACAVRTGAGEVKVASARKRVLAPGIQQPFLRGPLRLAESFAVLPELRRKLPEARLPFERPSVLAATIASAMTVQAVRRSPRLGGAARELLSGVLSLSPALFALRGGELAAYHGAEHISIGTYEHGERRREGARALRLAPDRPAARRLGRRQRAGGPRACAAAPPGPDGGLGGRRRRRGRGLRLDDEASAPSARQGAREARARASAPLRDRGADPEQLEVAEAALDACLELEHGDRAAR